jgi:hypothetical protein
MKKQLLDDKIPDGIECENLKLLETAIPEI